LPHSDIPGSQPVGDSPGLIAASHVLHRLLVPRHPPCALPSSASRSLERTKPAGSTFSQKEKINLSIYLHSAHPRQAAEFEKTICLLNYSSVLQVRTREGTKKGSTSVEPQRPAGGVVKSTYAIEDSNLRMTCVSSSQSRCAHSASGQYGAPRKSTISRRLRGVQLSSFQCVGGSPAEAWSRGDSNP
jgi:hypothetical protein